MQHENDRLRGVGLNRRQQAVEAFATLADLPEGVVDRRRPVHAANDLAAAGFISNSETVAMQTEGEFADVGNTGGYSEVPFVGEGSRVAARVFHAPIEMILADDTESGGLHRFGVRLDRR